MEVFILLENYENGGARVVDVFRVESEAVDKARELNEDAPRWIYYSVQGHYLNDIE